MKTMCRDVYAEGDLKDRVAKACGCLAAHAEDEVLGPLVRRFCKDGEGLRHYERVVAVAKAEGEIVARKSDGTPGTDKDKECVDNLAGARVEGAVDLVASACQEGATARLKNLLTLPEPARAGQCWRLERMNDDECVVAHPCIGGGAAERAALPVRNATGTTEGGETAVICHPVMQRLHRLKDPRRQNLGFNYPFANFLTQNRSSANVTYGAANCHGTAQAFAGDFLGKRPVDRLTFHSDEVKSRCGTEAQRLYDAAAQKAKDRGDATPKGSDLPVERGGYVVNMNHEASCDADACGTASMSTFACDEQGLESHVFIDGMCINCWGKLLEAEGYRPLPATATWRDLRRGAVLTAVDHTVTFIYASDGFCYVYESLSPFAPPQVNVHLCAELYDRFPRRWQPREDMTFDVR